MGLGCKLRSRDRGGSGDFVCALLRLAIFRGVRSSAGILPPSGRQNDTLLLD